jgi:hypothetical protein
VEIDATIAVFLSGKWKLRPIRLPSFHPSLLDVSKQQFTTIPHCVGADGPTN